MLTKLIFALTALALLVAPARADCARTMCEGPDPNGVPRSPTKHTVKIEKSLRLRQQPVTPSIDCAGFFFWGASSPVMF